MQIGYSQNQIDAYDEEEHTYINGGDPSPPPPCPGFDELAKAAQRVQVEGSSWPLVGESGWLVVHFDTDGQIFGPGFGHSFDQAWVNVRYFANNKYSASLSGTAMTNGCKMEHSDLFHVFYPTPTH